MKKVYLLCSLLYCGSFIAQQNIEDGLLLHYKFNGNVLDSSGNGYNASSYEIEYDIDKDGNENSVALFNGINSYIGLPNISQLKPELPITIALWVNFANLSNEQSVSFTTDFKENNHTGIWSSLSSERIAVSYGDNTGNTTSANRRSKVGSTILTADTWYHFVFVIKDTNDFKIYLNSVDDMGAYSGTSNNGLGYSNNSGSIGRKDSDTTRSPYYFNGSIDDFMYWNRALSQEEVDIVYNSNPLSIENFSKISDNQFYLYPNPTKRTLKIKSKKNILGASLYDVNGKKHKILFKKTRNKTIIDNLPKENGVYILTINTIDGSTTRRVLIK